MRTKEERARAMAAAHKLGYPGLVREGVRVQLEDEGWPRRLVEQAISSYDLSHYDYGSRSAEPGVRSKLDELAVQRVRSLRALDDAYRDDIRRWLRCIRDGRAERKRLSALLGPCLQCARAESGHPDCPERHSCKRRQEVTP